MNNGINMKKAIIVLLVAISLGFVSHFIFAHHARKSPKWQYAASALERSTPSYDLRYCIDLEAKDRKDFTNSRWKPMPCINTATSNYNPNLRAGNCARFVNDPGKWGFFEVAEKDAIPGDLIIFFLPNGYARHAAVYIQDSLFGPMCATTMYPKGGYYRYFPYKIVLWVTSRLGSFNKVKYYRYR